MYQLNLKMENSSIIKNKKRIEQFGEVNTQEKEVNNMLSLVNDECLRIDSRFLESACGDGNFLTNIFKKKLDIVFNKNKNNHVEFEKYALYSLSSLYGIEIQLDNVLKTRERLFEILNNYYLEKYKNSLIEEFVNSAKYILKKNIIHGDALSLKIATDKKKDIIFAEWSMVNSTDFKRRDYTFNELLAYQPIEGNNLFSDLGEQAFIPSPIKEFKPIHYLKIYDYFKTKS